MLCSDLMIPMHVAHLVAARLQLAGALWEGTRGLVELGDDAAQRAEEGPI